MTESIKEVLMRRDNISEERADELISEAREAMFDYLSVGDQDAAECVCMEYFGLEPDYMYELF